MLRKTIFIQASNFIPSSNFCGLGVFPALVFQFLVFSPCWESFQRFLGVEHSNTIVFQIISTLKCSAICCLILPVSPVALTLSFWHLIIRRVGREKEMVIFTHVIRKETFEQERNVKSYFLSSNKPKWKLASLSRSRDSCIFSNDINSPCLAPYQVGALTYWLYAKL